MIADMSLSGFSPSDVSGWSFSQWASVSEAMTRAYAQETIPEIPPPSADEFRAFIKKGTIH